MMPFWKSKENPTFSNMSELKLLDKKICDQIFPVNPSLFMSMICGESNIQAKLTGENRKKDLEYLFDQEYDSDTYFALHQISSSLKYHLKPTLSQVVALDTNGYNIDSYGRRIFLKK